MLELDTTLRSQGILSSPTSLYNTVMARHAPHRPDIPRITTHHSPPTHLSSPSTHDQPPILLSVTPRPGGHPGGPTPRAGDTPTPPPPHTPHDSTNHSDPPYRTTSPHCPVANPNPPAPSALPSPANLTNLTHPTSPTESDARQEEAEDGFGMKEFLEERGKDGGRGGNNTTNHPPGLPSNATPPLSDQLASYDLTHSEAREALDIASLQGRMVFHFHLSIPNIITSSPASSPQNSQALLASPGIDTIIETMACAGRAMESSWTELQSLKPTLRQTSSCPRPQVVIQDREQRSRALLSDIHSGAKTIRDTRHSPAFILARDLISHPWPTPTTLNLSGDARRTGDPSGRAQCALAAARNVSRNPQIDNDILLAFPAGRGWDGQGSATQSRRTHRPKGTNLPQTITRIQWIPFLTQEVVRKDTERACRGPCDIVSSLSDTLLSHISHGIILENLGGGIATHATVVIRDPLATLQPAWHYLDNEAAIWPAPRPPFGITISAAQLRRKVRDSRSMMLMVTKKDGPLDTLLREQSDLREADAGIQPRVRTSRGPTEPTTLPGISRTLPVITPLHHHPLHPDPHPVLRPTLASIARAGGSALHSILHLLSPSPRSRPTHSIPPPTLASGHVFFRDHEHH